MRALPEWEARESWRKDMIRLTGRLADFAADPHRNDDVAPHLLGRS
jgi:hypothetical protein